MGTATPVLMLGLDAADEARIDALAARGRLPALTALRAAGTSGSLASGADLFAGGVWPSFYTGRDVAWHGIYHNKLWRPEAMRYEVPTDRWLGARPFWEEWRGRGLRACIVDVPMILGKPRPLDGIYVGGWGTHDLISRGSWPEGLWAGLARRHGRPAMPRERFGRQTTGSLLALRGELLRSIEQSADVALDLLGRERWDFSCIVFGAVHRVGHYLTDLSQLADEPSPREREILEGAVDELYEATDHAMARLLERVDPGTRIVAFALHGMGPNPGWSDLMADILREAEAASTGRAARTGLLYAVRRRMPMHLVRPLLNRLPGGASDALVALWSSGMLDWRRTRHFPMPMDHAAYLRVNLRGREREGIVEEGEYAQACAALAAVVEGLHDRKDGACIAGRAAHAFADAPGDAPCRHLLPDLVVPWSGPRAGSFAELTSDALPSLRYRVPARLPSGRSGNHLGRGWFVARGPGIAAKRRVAGHDIRDLAPTVEGWLGIEPRDRRPGRRIPVAAEA
ncbi:MAG TPA: alkaline phosphatase family protein [Steroidobacteraceae bacterium]|nr:alkaline phosphatase family protein [Steroidobacteraceae bacterium]